MKSDCFIRFSREAVVEEEDKNGLPKVSRLLVDVTNRGGNSGCLRVFFNGFTIEKLYTPVEMRPSFQLYALTMDILREIMRKRSMDASFENVTRVAKRFGLSPSFFCSGEHVNQYTSL